LNKSFLWEESLRKALDFDRVAAIAAIGTNGAGVNWISRRGEEVIGYSRVLCSNIKGLKKVVLSFFFFSFCFLESRGI